jgi:phospholipid transport system substrate-binding protein
MEVFVKRLPGLIAVAVLAVRKELSASCARSPHEKPWRRKMLCRIQSRWFWTGMTSKHDFFCKNGCRVLRTIPLLLVLTYASAASAQTAKEQLQDSIDRIIAVLRTIRGAQDIEANKPRFREILQTRFDFAAMAEKSLGDRWQELDSKDEFISVFTEFIEASYMGTLGSYQGEKVVYDTDRVDGQLAEVGTRVVGGRGKPIEVLYKLHLKNREWMVYDVVIDNVSVILNYQSQFRRVLQKSSLAELIRMLREKTSG